MRKDPIPSKHTMTWRTCECEKFVDAWPLTGGLSTKLFKKYSLRFDSSHLEWQICHFTGIPCGLELFHVRWHMLHAEGDNC